MTDVTRELIVRWENPAPFAEAAQRYNGLEFLRAIKTGELPRPPMMQLLGIEPVDAAEGKVSFTVTPGEQHYNPLGVVHGGLAATICDTAMGCAVQSLLPAGTGYTTLEFKINFLRPLTAATGAVLAEGTAIHVGRRSATADARLFDGAGRLCAHATTTCLIMRPTESLADTTSTAGGN